jgi:hypothetical protein
MNVLQDLIEVVTALSAIKSSLSTTSVDRASYLSVVYARKLKFGSFDEQKQSRVVNAPRYDSDWFCTGLCWICISFEYHISLSPSSALCGVDEIS